MQSLNDHFVFGCARGVLSRSIQLFATFWNTVAVLCPSKFGSNCLPHFGILWQFYVLPSLAYFKGQEHALPITLLRWGKWANPFLLFYL